MRSIIDNVQSLKVISAQELTSTKTSDAIDTMGFNTSMLVLNIGAIDHTTGDETYVAIITECNTDDGQFADSGLVLPIITKAAVENKIVEQAIDGLGTSRKRYIKLVLTLAGTSPSIEVSATLELGRAYKQPVDGAGIPDDFGTTKGPDTND